jgi:hypothetical protein
LSVEQCSHGNYEISFHAEKEHYAEDISLLDIEAAIANGEILEDYPNDPRGKAALSSDMQQDDPSILSVVTHQRSQSE